MRHLEPYQMDILKEIINIGVGRAAGILNEMTKFRVILQVPFIKVLSSFSLKEEMEELDRNIIAAVRLGFKGPFSGCAALVFPPDSASKLVAVLTGEEPGTPDLDSVRVGTLSEVGNIVLNGVMGSIGNILKQHISYSIPTYIEDTIENLLTIDTNINPPPNTILLVRIRFTIQQLQIEGDIILLFEVGSFTALLSAIDAIRAD
jgi:chemotaxis protein CheC